MGMGERGGKKAKKKNKKKPQNTRASKAGGPYNYT